MMKTPKQTENLRRKVARKLCAQGRRTGTGLQVRCVEQAARGKRKMAVVSVGRTNFYDPTVAVQMALKSLFDPNLTPLPVSHVDAAKVDYQPPCEETFRKHSFMALKAFIRRMKMIVRDEKYVKAWKARHKHGMFFMYSERVILQTWTAKEGFRVQRVPEEGLDCVPPGLADQATTGDKRWAGRARTLKT